MIEVLYKQRFGNNLFQYCFGRILALELGFELKADPIPGFPNTNQKVKGHNYSKYPIERIVGQVNDLSRIINNKSRRKIVLDGYFQKYDHYRKYKDQIRNNWLKTEQSKHFLTNHDDVVMCVRRGDYVPKHALPFSYYTEALSHIKYRKVYICTDDISDPFIIFLKLRYNAIVMETNLMDNFEFIRSFEKIIISNSTFCWWAAFLSEAKEVYMPLPLRGFWSPHYQINLQVNDDARYKIIKCKETYKRSIREKLIQSVIELRNHL